MEGAGVSCGVRGEMRAGHWRLRQVRGAKCVGIVWQRADAVRYAYYCLLVWLDGERCCTEDEGTRDNKTRGTEWDGGWVL